MLGNAARIFTSLKETNDIIMVGGFVVSFILNLIIFLQIIYYNKKDDGKQFIELKNKKDVKKEENEDKNKNGKRKKNKKVE